MSLPLDHMGRFGPQRMYSQNDTGGSTPHSGQDDQTQREPQLASEAPFDTKNTMATFAQRAAAIHQMLLDFTGEPGLPIEAAAEGTRAFPQALAPYLNVVSKAAAAASANMEAYGAESADQQDAITGELLRAGDGGTMLALTNLVLNRQRFDEAAQVVIRGYGDQQVLISLQDALNNLRGFLNKNRLATSGVQVVRVVDGVKRRVPDNASEVREILLALTMEMNAEATQLRQELATLELAGDLSREIKKATNPAERVKQAVRDAIASEDIATMLELISIAVVNWDEAHTQADPVLSGIRNGLAVAGKAARAFFEDYAMYYFANFYGRSAKGIDETLAESSMIQTMVALYFLRRQVRVGLQPSSVSQMIRAGLFPNLAHEINELIVSQYRALYDQMWGEFFDAEALEHLQDGRSAELIRSLALLPQDEIIEQQARAFLHAIPQVVSHLRKPPARAVEINEIEDSIPIETINLQMDDEYLNIRIVAKNGYVLLLQFHTPLGGNVPRDIYGIPNGISAEEQQALGRVFALMHRELIPLHYISPESAKQAVQPPRRSSHAPSPTHTTTTQPGQKGDRESRMAQYSGMPKPVAEKGDKKTQPVKPVVEVPETMPTDEGVYGIIIEQDAKEDISGVNKVLRKQLGRALRNLQIRLQSGNPRQAGLQDIEGYLKDLGYWRLHVGSGYRAIIEIRDHDGTPKLHIFGFAPKDSNKTYRRIERRAKAARAQH